MIMGRPPKDLAGMKFGKLTAIKIIEHGGTHKPVKWLCKCSCGREKIVDSQLLQSKAISDCGCSTIKRLVGRKFGRLTVIDSTAKRDIHTGSIIWKCQCDCGNIVYVSTSNLESNSNHRTQSCGCLRRENSTKHSLSKTKLYKKLVAIKGRCKNPKNANYFRYGGRGIGLCSDWDGKQGFENFYVWAIAHGYEDGLTIDRIDNNKGYSPDNCRWVTQKLQMNNTRRNRYITIDGETHSLTDWAEIKGISIGTIRDRLKRGWSEYDAIMRAVRK